MFWLWWEIPLAMTDDLTRICLARIGWAWRPGHLFQALMESLILAQDERWRRA